MTPEETLIPLAAIFLIFGAPVAALVIWRVLAHNERMAMIRAGMVPPTNSWGKNWQQANWAPPSGSAQHPGFQQPASPPRGSCQSEYLFPGDYAQQQLAKGVRLTLIGVALLIGLSFIGHGYFGPWMLGGLIPMFVGVAQIITAVLAGARFSPQDRGVGTAPPQPGFYANPPPGPAQAPPAGAPYGWRPGPTPEIEKPAGPPDVR